MSTGKDPTADRGSHSSGKQVEMNATRNIPKAEILSLTTFLRACCLQENGGNET